MEVFSMKETVLSTVKGTDIPTRILIEDNGKGIKPLKNFINWVDKKLFVENNKVSNLVKKYCKSLAETNHTMRKSVLLSKGAKFTAAGLALVGGYQLIKGAVNAFSNK